jgi:PhnB protein
MIPASRQGDEPMTILAPQLSVRRGRSAIAFYQAAFGAAVVFQMGGGSDGEGVVAQLAVDEATFWVADESPEHHNFSPETLGGGTTRMLLIVPDPEGLVRQATLAGATLVQEVVQEYGWQLGRIRDPFGHHWEIGRPTVPWPPESTR